MQADTDRERETAMQEVPAQASKASKAEPGGGGGGKLKMTCPSWRHYNGFPYIIALFFFLRGRAFISNCMPFPEGGGLPAVE